MVVTRADLLADPSRRAEAQEEIERFRLAPVLGPLKVRWFFSGLDEPLVGLLAHVTDALGPDPATAHRPSALDALRDLLDGAAGRLEERLAKRESELAVLRDVDAQLPLILTHIQDEVRLTGVSIRDALRRACDRLDESVDETVRAAEAWISRAGTGAWADVELPLRQAVASLALSSGEALEQERRRFQGETRRMEAKLERAERALQLPVTKSVALRETWTTPELREAIAAVSAWPLDPTLKAFRKACDDEVRVRKERAAEDSSLADRLGATLRALASIPFQDRARERLLADVKAGAGPRIERLEKEASRVVLQRADEDATGLGAALRDRLKAMSTALSERHAWGGAYAELLELQAWVSRP